MTAHQALVLNADFRQLARLSLLGCRARELDPLAQRTERHASNVDVAGSTPARVASWRTNRRGRQRGFESRWCRQRYGLRLRPSSANMESEPAGRPAPVGSRLEPKGLRIGSAAFLQLERQPERPPALPRKQVAPHGVAIDTSALLQSVGKGLVTRRAS